MWVAVAYGIGLIILLRVRPELFRFVLPFIREQLNWKYLLAGCVLLAIVYQFTMGIVSLFPITRSCVKEVVFKMVGVATDCGTVGVSSRIDIILSMVSIGFTLVMMPILVPLEEHLFRKGTRNILDAIVRGGVGFGCIHVILIPSATFASIYGIMLGGFCLSLLYMVEQNRWEKRTNPKPVTVGGYSLDNLDFVAVQNVPGGLGASIKAHFNYNVVLSVYLLVQLWLRLDALP